MIDIEKEIIKKVYKTCLEVERALDPCHTNKCLYPRDNTSCSLCILRRALNKLGYKEKDLK